MMACYMYWNTKYSRKYPRPLRDQVDADSPQPDFTLTEADIYVWVGTTSLRYVTVEDPHYKFIPSPHVLITDSAHSQNIPIVAAVSYAETKVTLTLPLKFS
jgi:hypothetical protein